MGRELLVKVRGVLMNKYCRQRKDHPLGGAKHCPYCRVCRHGKNEYQHCDKCNADDSWRRAPISDAEMEEVLAWFSHCDPGEGMARRRKRYYHSGVHLVPLAIRRLRQLVRDAAAKAKKKAKPTRSSA